VQTAAESAPTLAEGGIQCNPPFDALLSNVDPLRRIPSLAAPPRPVSVLTRSREPQPGPGEKPQVRPVRVGFEGTSKGKGRFSGRLFTHKTYLEVALLLGF
jgi:hypothetical protein